MKTLMFLTLSIAISVAAIASERHVVVVTDSQGNCSLGSGLVKGLNAWEGTSFKLVSIGGSSPASWTNEKTRFGSKYTLSYTGPGKNLKQSPALRSGTTPLFRALLSAEFSGKTQDKTTIIALGTNSKNAEELKTTATKMIQQVHAAGSRCVWAGPATIASFLPQNTELQKQAIKDAILAAGPNANGASCEFIDSTELTHYPFTAPSKKIDGLHYCWHPFLLEIGSQWAEEIIATVKSEGSF